MCKIEKALTEYNKKTSKLDGLQNICKSCSQQRSRQYYQDNIEKHKVEINRNKKKYSIRNYELIERIKAFNGCALCAEDDTCCYDFHHLDPKTKKYNISEMVGGSKSSWNTIVEEIAKCVCVCSNCHRKIHAGKRKVGVEHLLKIPDDSKMVSKLLR